jgi:hypothetical protein
MWPTEFMVHEHRKEMQRVAAQMRLVNSVRTPQPSMVARWRNQVIASLSFFRRPAVIEVQPHPQSQPCLEPCP